jgi:hypothetical protein
MFQDETDRQVRRRGWRSEKGWGGVEGGVEGGRKEGEVWREMWRYGGKEGEV